MQLAKIIWITLNISTKIENKCLIKAVMKFLGWNCSATTAKVENYSEKKNPALHNLSPTLRAKIKVKIHQGCARLHCILILTFPWSSVHYWGPWQESGSTVQQQWSVAPNSKNPPKIRLKKSWNWLIRIVPAIECEAHVMTGNGSFVNLLNHAKKNLWKHIKLNFFCGF